MIYDLVQMKEEVRRKKLIEDIKSSSDALERKILESNIKSDEIKSSEAKKVVWDFFESNYKKTQSEGMRHLTYHYNHKTSDLRFGSIVGKSVMIMLQGTGLDVERIHCKDLLKKSNFFECRKCNCHIKISW